VLTQLGSEGWPVGHLSTGGPAKCTTACRSRRERRKRSGGAVGIVAHILRRRINDEARAVYDFQKMSAEAQNVFVFEGGDIRFVIFDAAVADTSTGIKLYKLPYARNLIRQPDALGQVGGLLDQVTGRTRPGSQPQSAPASPLQKYVVAKTDGRTESGTFAEARYRAPKGPSTKIPARTDIDLVRHSFQRIYPGATFAVAEKC
jgi:hypothetical protein